MKSWAGTIIVTALAVAGAIAGFLGSSSYIGFRGALAGFQATCHTLRIGEMKQVLTPAERLAIARLLAKSGGVEDERFRKYFEGDCAKSPLDFAADAGKKPQ